MGEGVIQKSERVTTKKAFRKHLYQFQSIGKYLDTDKREQTWSRELGEVGISR